MTDTNVVCFTSRDDGAEKLLATVKDRYPTFVKFSVSANTTEAVPFYELSYDSESVSDQTAELIKEFCLGFFLARQIDNTY
jgi:hypothetical protein